MAHCALLMQGWQHKAAFVIQFRPEAEIESDVFEGRIEHVASARAIRFHSLEDMLIFMARILAEVRTEKGD